VERALLHDPGAVAAEEFLGLPVARLEMEEALGAVRRASRGAAWQYVVTPNAAHFARLRGADSGLVAIYRQADFCFLDSRVIAASARLMGLRPPPVVPGADLVAQLFQRGMATGSSVCVIGADKVTVACLRQRFAIGTVSHKNPSMGFWQSEAELEETVAFIVAQQADYTFLVVGSPQQEILAARVAAAGSARGVGICAGAAIDFITGAQHRAPRFLQRMALEWAYRLCTEPRRLAHRYMVESPRGIMLVLRYGFRQQAGT
jgi:N-acetylglucosaminyldiphosphoundecaprenol N-acetyl-beta-D-mannosaminyltransferase